MLHFLKLCKLGCVFVEVLLHGCIRNVFCTFLTQLKDSATVPVGDPCVPQQLSQGKKCAHRLSHVRETDGEV